MGCLAIPRSYLVSETSCVMQHRCSASRHACHIVVAVVTETVRGMWLKVRCVLPFADWHLHRCRRPHLGPADGAYPFCQLWCASIGIHLVQLMRSTCLARCCTTHVYHPTSFQYERALSLSQAVTFAHVLDSRAFARAGRDVGCETSFLL